ncbi:MAG: ERCC4 domain-containing protein [Candidatus ainarchaeum sp.]|nr:ERCC4 domain-containing protein [Candidatus ainarchaeum sp.]MDD3976025.1 ERCC4 domain-containing protein [Candidatus ainarchaeum sp.]
MSKSNSKLIKIICDQRERASQVISKIKSLESSSLKIDLVIEQLAVGDYILSDDVVIERKTIADLESSILDGRVFSQLNDLSQVKKPGIIIEGNLDLIYNNSTRLDKKAIMGLFTTIGLNYKIPLFFTKNQKETAEMLYVISKREQIQNGNNLLKLRFAKSKMSYSQRQLFIVESFPDVGPTLSRSILKEFKNIKNLANATIEDLRKVKKLGPKKADKIKYLFERDFS